MKKFFVRLICCFIPVRTWRHKVRAWFDKPSSEPCIVNFGGNNDTQAINNIQTLNKIYGDNND